MKLTTKQDLVVGWTVITILNVLCIAGTIKLLFWMFG